MPSAACGVNCVCAVDAEDGRGVARVGKLVPNGAQEGREFSSVVSVPRRAIVLTVPVVSGDYIILDDDDLVS